MKRFYYFLVLHFTAIIVWGQIPDRGMLLRDSLIISFDRSGILEIYDGFNLPEAFFPIDYDLVEIHKLVYLTPAPTGDSLTIASGLITIPISSQCLPLVSYQHGTLTYDSAVSDMNAKFDQHFFGVPFAANGYVLAMPDYLGLGTTSLAHHPFNHAETEATAIVDMLRAAGHFCDMKDVELSDQIFLVGYSQGGHATMSAHRELEAFHQDEFKVTASAPGGGAYQLSSLMRDSMLFSDEFSNPFFIAYAIISWQSVYEDIFSEIGEVFRPPFDSIILRIFNRQNPESHLIDSLPYPGVTILQPDFLASVIADTFHPLNVALRDNDVYDWLPVAPVRLYYCEGDEVIPHANSLFTYNHMLALGANIDLFDGGPNFTHATCTYPAVIGAKLWFDEFRETCALATVQKEQGQTILHPNPFQHEIRIIEQWSGFNELEELNVYELSGNQLYALPVNPFQKSFELDLTPGVYVFEIVRGNRRTWQKMIRM